eukprot:TRINITY_DN3054_c0_g2_i5.p2 TRINITY_DN3054_c0_g2~~TRINITY_DN3054_c0_g2_i5.p2  ORF type:complete len:213 (+),score=115.09 TRINITY_DN3054_c0_g2_i5:46-684(+)
MGKHTVTEAKAKATVIDMKGHLLGRICSTVAKKLQNGEQVTLVRCEATNISGSHHRNKLKMLDRLRKRTLTNPKKGPFHHRAPSAMIERTIRGMLSNNHRNQSKRKKSALARLTVYDGIPRNVERKKRMVCPLALRVLRLAPQRDFCTLGRLSHELGWQHQADVANCEAERKARAAKYFESKKTVDSLYAEAKAEASKKHSKEAALLAQFGY